MSNPTTPFSWQMPTATDLVTDLPADFEVFGQAVATSMADLLGGTTGQILSKTTNADMDFTWIANDQGDITAVNVTSPINGGGTAGAVTIGIDASSTTQSGAVQLEDSTASTSTTKAATPNSVKSAYDLANAAITKSTVTTAGDIIYRNATVPTRLPIGTAGQVLKVNSGATAPEWGSAGSSATSYSLINTGGTSLSGATTTVSGLSGYNKLFVIISNFSFAGPTGMWVRFNSDTGSNYRQAGLNVANDATWSTSILQGVYGNLLDRADLGVYYGTTQVGGFTMSIDGCNSSGVKVWDTSLGVQAATNAMFQGMGTWTNSSAISSISFIGQTQSWDSGTVYIYGA